MSRNLGGPNAVGRSPNSALRWSPYQAMFSEDDIRRLSSPAAFKQGDAWQRAGHVHQPTLLDNGIGAEVVGTWQRTDTVEATTAGSRIRTECSCKSGEFCRHAAALLLHWLRNPTSFSPGGPAAEFIADTFAGPASQFQSEDDGEDEDEESATSEFARLLAQDTMTHLRQIARERDLQVTARNKAELIEQLAATLSTAESVDAALMRLDDDARIALAAVELANAAEKSTGGAIGKAYRALGGTGTMRPGAPPEAWAPPVAAETLVHRGLIIPGDRYAHPPSSYVVPRAVAGPLAAWMRREGRLRDLLRPATGPPPETGVRQSATGTFTLLEIFGVIVHEIVRGAIGARTPAIPRTETAFVPPGWRTDPTQSATIAPSNPRGNVQPSVRRLTPLPLPITHADLRHLIDLTGLPTVMIEFAIELMLALGLLDIVVEPTERRVQANQNLLQALLSVHPTHRLVVMSDMYVNMADSIDLRSVVGPKRPLQLHYRASYYSSVAPYQPQDSTVRHVLMLLLAWLAENEGEDRWYDVASLLDFFWNLGPALLGQSAPHYGEWWFAPGEQPETRLNLEAREDWERVMKPLLSSMLAGPLTWLGLVDVVGDEGQQPVAFRALETSQVLAGEINSALAEAPSLAAPLLFNVAGTDGALTVDVPAGNPDPAIHTLLSTIGELQQVSREGLRYRVTAERLQPIFEGGITGADLVNGLARRTGGALPDIVQETIDRWWAGYGSIRLYDDVTLIELGDDVLLRELRATSSLDNALVHVFSPRLIAVDGAIVQDLIAELRRLGHTPRVVEGSVQPSSSSRQPSSSSPQQVPGS